MNLRELVDQHLPLRQDRLPLVLHAGVLGVLLGLPLLCCCGGFHLLSRDQRQPTPVPTNVRDLPLDFVEESATKWPPLEPVARGDLYDNPMQRDAVELLAAAAEDKHGQILVWERHDGLSVQTGSHKFCEPAAGAREAARWRDALNVLRAGGWIEYSRSSVDVRSPRGGQFTYWRVTSAGYALADRLPIAKADGSP